jgi:hypothetical protein
VSTETEQRRMIPTDQERRVMLQYGLGLEDAKTFMAEMDEQHQIRFEQQQDEQQQELDEEQEAYLLGVAPRPASFQDRDA